MRPRRIFALLLWEKTVAMGFLLTPMTRPERIAAFIAAPCLLGEFRFSGEVGFASVIAGAPWRWPQRSRAAMAAA
jgi:hypothetical protein